MCFSCVLLTAKMVVIRAYRDVASAAKARDTVSWLAAILIAGNTDV